MIYAILNENDTLTYQAGTPIREYVSFQNLYEDCDEMDVEEINQFDTLDIRKSHKIPCKKIAAIVDRALKQLFEGIQLVQSIRCDYNRSTNARRWHGHYAIEIVASEGYCLHNVNNGKYPFVYQHIIVSVPENTEDPAQYILQSFVQQFNEQISIHAR